MIDDADLAPAAAPSDISLRRVASIAARQISLEDQVAQAEARIKELKTELQMVKEADLPRAMGDCGMAEFKLLDGSSVSIETDYRCGQLDDGPVRKNSTRTVEENLEGLYWLEDNDHGDLAKNLITVQLNKGQEELAAEIVDYLRSLKSNSMTFDRRRAVLWNTLAAFARRQEEQGDDVPLDKLGITRVTYAKISRARR